MLYYEKFVQDLCNLIVWVWNDMKVKVNELFLKHYMGLYRYPI